MRSRKPASHAGATVRLARASDVPQIVDVHERAFPGFLMTLLGPRFLHEYYGGALADAAGLCVVAEDDGRIVGFAVGAVDPSAFYDHMRRQRVSLLGGALAHLARHPALWRRTWRSARSMTSRASSAESDAAELASLAVDPAVGGRGVGGRLVDDFARRAAASGRRRVVLTTDAEGNDEVNRFYVNRGFSLVGRQQQGSRVLNQYELAWVET